ncbi:sensor histidine kinase [Streptomonospora litoralis]|uniref:Sensor histidine kinase DesK n=1 Tax=Streptomonospora litoralis TaxID=2498135 RepID=A0A4P6Q8C8_9ACTN|nr:histidine kinase [Streptomonospora litoralis]QBI55459.1 Sensor histidine kinase DesK [Streptomonospora litoralis]
MALIGESADKQRSGDGAGTSAERVIPPRLAWTITAAVFGGQCLASLGQVLVRYPDLLPRAVAAICMASLFTLQMLHCGWAVRPDLFRRTRATLAVQLVLAFAPLGFYGSTWIAMPAFFAGSALLVLPGPLGWAAFAGALAAITAVQGVLTSDPTVSFYTAVATTNLSLAVYGVSYLHTAVERMRSAQDRLASAAVARERLQFSRELHDLLGHSISEIIIRAELAHRLMPHHHDRAQAELNEILNIGRQALSDTRSFCYDYRDLSLDEECRSVRTALSSAGVALDLHTDHRDIPTQAGTLVATLLREGATHVLRHSTARNCTITVEQGAGTVTAEIVNDGAGKTPSGGKAPLAEGLQSLAERASRLGGTMTAQYLPGRRFRLRLVLPTAKRSRAPLNMRRTPSELGL